MYSAEAGADVNVQKAVRMQLRQWQADIHTAYPAAVETVGEDRVSVRVGVRRELGGETAPAVIVPDVPVAYPGASYGRLSWPLSAGDTGLVVCLSRDADRWLAGQGDALPATLRMHDLSDMAFLPGLSPFGEASGVPECLTLETRSGSLTIDNAGTLQLVGSGGASVTLSPDGTIVLSGNVSSVSIPATGGISMQSRGEDMSALLLQLITLLSTTTIIPHSPGSPGNLSTQAELAKLVARFANLVG